MHLLGVAAFIAATLSGCYSSNPESDVVRSDSEYKTRREQLEEDYSTQQASDRESYRIEATLQARMEQDIEAEQRASVEERHKDAVRSCILAGNQPNLCELDPHDPYGEMNQP